MPLKKVHFATLGCKTNQYETQAMREKFLKAGYEEASRPEDADLFVVNTCTVTGEGDRKSRSVIRRLHRENPGAKIAVTGCYATLNQEEIQKLPGVSFVIANQEKEKIVERVNLDAAGKFCGEGDESESNRYSDLSISFFADRTRAFVKVQDGCDHACTYCKVVIVRGPSRSRAEADILEEASRLAEGGYQEIVLTGIQLGAYGDEWENGLNLTSVLKKLCAVKGLRRIRLSSIDPSDVTDEFIRCMSEEPKICAHLHLPLQSGDDTILKAMKRAYRRDQYLRIVEKLRKAMPDFSLTTDVMVAFPGETEEHFKNTVRVLEETLPLKAHIFPFSARKGTRAADFVGRLTPEVSRERVTALQAVSKDLAMRYKQRFAGRITEVLVENPNEKGELEGHTSNYLKVCFQGDVRWVGSLRKVRLLEAGPEHFRGEVITD